MSGISRFRRELRTAARPRPLAELLATGFTRSQLHGPGWRRTSHGFFVPATIWSGTGRPTPTQRILYAIPLIPEQGALTGWAAAFVQGVDVLDGLDHRTMAELPIATCTTRNLGRRSDRGITCVRADLTPEEVHERHGVRVTRPMRTAFDGARLARDLEDAVAYVDARAHAGTVLLPRLAAYVADQRRRKGAQQARRAVQLADPAARSPGESRLRVSYQLDAGLPRPQVNMPIFDLQERLLGIGDLVDEDAGLVTEFDGRLHRDRHRHHDDNVREERLESAGLVVVRADNIDLTSDRAELVRRMRDGHRRG